ncbi:MULTISPECIES: YhdH/YhfP family quinone oxidoreductase [Aerococcus]|uniref:YhdH/YhfP family quinone oxidoreductase n=1 Tax=Aerococcus TaxID=1375 RepID=UPI000DCD16E8|nr:MULTISPECIES: YhdH/YhfP family quinone oxidoreductase [Aerococcus]KAA9296184.1 YhdH/YhfP family quinone oxidoreductase [Aerococcus tenax]MDK6689221.1 YhdH/YhfP family quinone oxidoreductase [Aerococcus urinae]MDK8133695.1 YhdH/YhfP family quinone oxidoreductase [Aerococcus urinae]MDK8485129.1 YhdH/YhfP family quinone oxidoreductase [Aerococcus urinae]MDL5179101.1 YhdH/YhfP family quinone oxidoreductase [Aerococcus tenax]
MKETFKAVVVRSDGDETSYALEDYQLGDQPVDEGDTIVKLAYSSMNYKDMLATQHQGGVIRSYPLIPGIDASGEIVESSHPEAEIGQKVINTCSQAGVNHNGGYSQYLKVPYDWLVTLPEGLSEKEAMIYGTAGLTAAYSVDSLLKHGMTVDQQPEILVTGASGGVGSIALAILNRLGFKNVTALIRKDYQEELVKKLGAAQVIWPADLGGNKPLNKRRFDFVLDTVGGQVAAQAMTFIREWGSMTLCGNAGGNQLETTVLPLILRGVNLLGINSQELDIHYRQELWNKLATDWKVVDRLTYDSVGLDQIEETVEALKTGKHMGRTIIDLQDV